MDEIKHITTWPQAFAFAVGTLAFAGVATAWLYGLWRLMRGD